MPVINDASARATEGKWLIRQMSNNGISNSHLHKELVSRGFDGFTNNISMWRTGATQIPDRWLVAVFEFLCGDEPVEQLVELLRVRHADIAEYINTGNGTAKEPSAHTGKETSADEPIAITYIARSGDNQGKEFRPFVNKHGKYQGGVSRFAKDIEEFDSLEGLVNRLREDPKFKVRMSIPDEKHVAPSLVAQKSLIIREGGK